MGHPPGRGRFLLRVNRAEGNLWGRHCLVSSGLDLGRPFWARNRGSGHWTPFLPSQGRWMPSRQENLPGWVWILGEMGISSLCEYLSNLPRLASNKKEATRLERSPGSAEGKGSRRHRAKSRYKVPLPSRAPRLPPPSRAPHPFSCHRGKCAPSSLGHCFPREVRRKRSRQEGDGCPPPLIKQEYFRPPRPH